MTTQEIIHTLRSKAGLSQEELAEKVHVTRQAVSRGETGDTVPGIDTLKLLSTLFDVSINTLLGAPQTLVCQCCGMPLEDGTTSREKDGTFNEDYCKWCYADGKFTYTRMKDLVDFCVEHFTGDACTPDQMRAYMNEKLPRLKYWRRQTP